MDISTIDGLNTALAPVSPSAPPQGIEERRAMIQAVRAVNAADLCGPENELSFAFDRHSQRTVVRIVDKKTREVLQQIPNEQVLRLAEELQQRE